jgi:hypothetical protein
MRLLIIIRTICPFLGARLAILVVLLVTDFHRSPNVMITLGVIVDFTLAHLIKNKSLLDLTMAMSYL